MTELERRALLGDQEAQKECTEQGLVLPCPFCREAKNLVVRNVCGDAFVECLRCHATSSLTSSPDTTIKDWNTRPAPPIGRCGTCKWFGAVLRSGNHTCKNYEMPYCKEYDYCSHYEPREEEL